MGLGPPPAPPAPPALVVAAPHSGSGKTVVTLALLAALKCRGLAVQPFKVGPDFIDPGLHTRVTGRQSRNLDGWMLPREYNRALFQRLAGSADAALVEGVMGLYDGYDGSSEAGSTAEMAKWLGLPVLLVVDARSMARSAAALVYGFTRFDPDLGWAGVVFNRIGSPGHLDYLKQAMVQHLPDLPVFGGLPRDPVLDLPERHLGLVTVEDTVLGEDRLERFAGLIEAHLDLDHLLAACRRPHPALEPAASAAAPPTFEAPTARATPGTTRATASISNIGSAAEFPAAATAAAATAAAAPGAARGGAAAALGAPPEPVRIAVARDAAFCFYYADNLELLEDAGAELAFFSPIDGEGLPPECAAVYLGGGYPELHARRLAANTRFLRDLRSGAAAGLPIYAECGGLMVLSRFIETAANRRLPMAALLPFGTRMLERRKALGYTEVQLLCSTPIGPPGLTLRGHEFHYSEIVSDPAEDGLNEADPLGPASNLARAYRLRSRTGRAAPTEGYLRGSVLASYVHLHWGSAPEAAGHFVAAARAWRRRRNSQ